MRSFPIWLSDFRDDVSKFLSDGLYTTNYWSFSFVVNSNFTFQAFLWKKLWSMYGTTKVVIVFRSGNVHVDKIEATNALETSYHDIV